MYFLSLEYCDKSTTIECTSACSGSGRAMAIRDNPNECPWILGDTCACTFCIEDKTTCQIKCANEGKELSDWTENQYGCTTSCECSCAELNKTECSNTCENQGFSPKDGVVNANGCDICDCSCDPLANETCQSQCLAEGKPQLIGALDTDGCGICYCGCTDRNCGSECPGMECQKVQ